MAQLPLIPSAADPWRLLTPTNIAARQAWPWSHSIQKHIDSCEPRPRESQNLLIASDYGGEHPTATHYIYCYLVVKGGTQSWLAAMDATRRRSLPNGRTMSYKRLDDSYRQAALIPFLKAAANLDGHLVAIAVDKRKKWLSTAPKTYEKFRKDLGLTAKWNRRSFESMMRKVQFSAVILPIWSQPYTNLFWITDQDEFVANDSRHDDALRTAARVNGMHASHPLGILRFNTTGQDPEAIEREDLCAIPDLASGMLSEVANRLPKGNNWEHGFDGTQVSDLPIKAEIIADWFWDDQMILRKTFVSIDVEGPRYAVRKIWMQSGS